MNGEKTRFKRRRLQFSLAGLLLFMSLSCIAIFIFVITRPPPDEGNITIHGNVTFNGKPLKGASVKFVDESDNTSTGSTDQQGNYALTHDQLPPGNYKVTITPDGQARSVSSQNKSE